MNYGKKFVRCKVSEFIFKSWAVESMVISDPKIETCFMMITSIFFVLIYLQKSVQATIIDLKVD